MKRLIAAFLFLATPAWAAPLPALRLMVPLLGDLVRGTSPQSGGGGGGGLSFSDSAGLRAALNDETGTGVAVFGTSPTIGTPTISGGTSDALTSLGFRSTGAAFDVKMASAEVLTGTRTITWVLNDGNKTITLGGNVTTSGAFALTLTLSGTTGVTLPTSGTLATVSGALGTPSSVTLTNGTGLPIAGLTGLGTNVVTWLGTPSSANLAAALTDETGSGAAVFGTAPQISTIELGAASDTTVARTSAGVINVEGIDVLTQTNTITGITNKTFVAPVLGAATGTSIAIPSSGAANAVEIGETAGRVTFEGATADAFEGRLGWTDPTVGDQVILFPNLGAATTDTVATLGVASTWTQTQTFNGATYAMIINGTIIGNRYDMGTGSNQLSIRADTALTPDSGVIATSVTSGSVHIFENADFGYDFQNCSAATSAATDPILCIHSHTQGTTKWIEFSNNDTNGRINVGAGGLDVPAHLGAHGTAPIVSACGATPGTVTGNDNYGRVTTGTGGTVQSCTLTFATAFAATPVCVANDETAILLVRATPSTTALVIDSAVAGTLAAQVMTYVCHGL